MWVVVVLGEGAARKVRFVCCLRWWLCRAFREKKKMTRTFDFSKKEEKYKRRLRFLGNHN